MSRVLGMNAKLYRSAELLEDASSSDVSGATWIEISNVRDVTLNLETGEADVTTRANSGWKQTLPTLKDGSIEFEMVWDTADAGFAAIRDAWQNNDEIALAAMDGDIDTAAQGLVGNFVITNFSRTEPLEDALKVSVTAKPSSFTQWYNNNES
jgi:hypothetical protein